MGGSAGLFEELAAEAPDDGPIALYRRRAQELLESPRGRLGRGVDREDEVAATGPPPAATSSGESRTMPGADPGRP